MESEPVLKCLYHYVLVELDPPKDEIKTDSGLYIPSLQERGQHTGTVKYVGDGRIDKDGNITPLVVKPGDRVLFSKYAGMKIYINGVEYKYMREDEIIAIILDEGKGLDVVDGEV